MATDSFTYVVADQYGTQTGVVTVTIEGGGVAFVSASNDSASTLKGTTVTISPLGNDTFSTGLGPLRIKPGSLSTPSPSGTATIASNGRDVEFTPASGYEGAVTFTYVAQSTVDSTKESTATVTVSVTAETAVGNYPTTANNVTLTAGGNLGEKLDNAYSAAGPDTTIWLPPGDYKSPVGNQWYFSKATGLSASKPLVIRPISNNWNGPKFTSRVVVFGPDHILAGVEMDGAISGDIMIVRGNRSRISRCKINYLGESSATGIKMNSGADMIVDRNRICIKNGGPTDNSSGRGIAYGDTADLPTRPVIEWNYLHDFNGRGATNFHEPIQMGRGTDSGTRSPRGIVRYNLMERCTIDSEVISCKSSDNTLTNNVIRDCGSCVMTSRHGSRNVWVSCLSDNSGGFNVFQDAHQYIGCKVITKGSLLLCAGTVTVANYDPKSGENKPAATNVKVHHCEGSVDVGRVVTAKMDFPALNCEVKSHTGTIKMTPAGSAIGQYLNNGTITSGSAPGSKPSIVNLTASNTGQNAA